MVAAQAAAAQAARDVLARFGIDVDDAENGVFLPGDSTRPNPDGRTLHRGDGVHSTRYYAEVNSLLARARGRQDVVEALEFLAHDLRGDATRGGEPSVETLPLGDSFRPGVHDPGVMTRNGREPMFSPKERVIAQRLATDGAAVHPRPRFDDRRNQKNPDAMVRWSAGDAGTITEFKTLDAATSGAVRDSIRRAAKQLHPLGGGDLVIDGRVVGLTADDARRGYARAAGQARQHGQPLPRVVRFIMPDGSMMKM